MLTIKANAFLLIWIIDILPSTESIIREKNQLTVPHAGQSRIRCIQNPRIELTVDWTEQQFLLSDGYCFIVWKEFFELEHSSLKSG